MVTILIIIVFFPPPTGQKVNFVERYGELLGCQMVVTCNNTIGPDLIKKHYHFDH